jgi:type II secretory pathway component GspD/PulD (secretin)
LFRSDYKEGTSRERIYVISARIVGAPEAPTRSR